MTRYIDTTCDSAADSVRKRVTLVVSRWCCEDMRVRYKAVQVGPGSLSASYACDYPARYVQHPFIVVLVMFNDSCAFEKIETGSTS